MRKTASTAQSATAMTNTSTEIGRRKAVRMSHMMVSFSSISFHKAVSSQLPC
jgi:hypothetical protein